MMRTFAVHLLAGDRSQRLDEIVSFVGIDESGSFGLMAGHERFMTVLVFGLASLRFADGSRRYAGLPGGVLRFVDGELRISTRRFLLGDEAAAIGERMSREMLAEEHALARLRSRLRQLEAGALHRLALLERG